MVKKLIAKIDQEVDEAVQNNVVIQGNEDVLRVKTYGTAPLSASENDYYINKQANTLHKYVSGVWIDVTSGASSAILYLTADTDHVLTYSVNEGFRDVSQVYIDNQVTALQNRMDELEALAAVGMVL